MKYKIHEEVGQHELTLEEQHAQLQLEFRHFKEEHSQCDLAANEQMLITRKQLVDCQRNLKSAMQDRDKLKQRLEIAEQEKILWLAELKKMTNTISKRQRLIDNYEKDLQEKREKDAKKRARKTKAKPTSPALLRRSG